jgi:hypothetical protein
MTPRTSLEEDNHQPGDITSGLFNDIGWDATVGMDRLNNNSLIVVYPNPTSEYLKIKVNDKSQLFRVRLLALDGSELMVIENPTRDFTLKVNNLSKGLYFLEIKHNKHHTTHKKIILL